MRTAAKLDRQTPYSKPACGSAQVQDVLGMVDTGRGPQQACMRTAPQQVVGRQRRTATHARAVLDPLLHRGRPHTWLAPADNKHARAQLIKRRFADSGGKYRRASTVQVSWECQEELFRADVEDADDIRLSVKLFRTCIKEKREFCGDVPPGNSHAQSCLESSRDRPGFGQECRCAGVAACACWG